MWEGKQQGVEIYVGLPHLQWGWINVRQSAVKKIKTNNEHRMKNISSVWTKENKAYHASYSGRSEQ